MVEPGNAPTGDGAAEVEAVLNERPEEGPGYRAGERTLTVLATSLNYLVLRSLAAGPMRLADLRRATGLPAQTTLRGHLSTLTSIGLIEKRPTQRMPYSVENALTPMGEDVLGVAALLESWLDQAPGGPIALDSGAAKGVIKAFVDGWSSTMVQAMAARPMSLTELDRGIAELSYPALERRLASMRMAGLVEARPGEGSGTPYAMTAWGRQLVCPLVAAGHYEALHLGPRAAPVANADIEAAFMLAMPLAGLPDGLEGCCRLEVEPNGTAVSEPVAVRISVEAGRVVSCDRCPDPHAGPFAAGSAETWLFAVGKGDPGRLRLGGSRQLAEAIVAALHAALARR